MKNPLSPPLPVSLSSSPRLPFVPSGAFAHRLPRQGIVASAGAKASGANQNSHSSLKAGCPLQTPCKPPANPLQTTCKPWNNQEFTVTFQGTLAGANQSQITVDTTNINAGMATVVDTEITDTQGGGSVNEVQTVTLSNATDGTIRLAFAGQTTAPIAYNASAATVASALADLATIGSGNVAVNGSSGGPCEVACEVGEVGEVGGQPASDSSLGGLRW